MEIKVYADRASWLRGRAHGIGASDAASCLGVSPWKSNVQLWREKTGVSEPEDIGGKPAVRYGVAAEPLLRAFWEIDHPEYKLSFTPYKIITTILDGVPISCTPDGELEDSNGAKGGLEIKTTELHSSAAWKQWDNAIPDAYYAQVLHQMVAADWAFCELLAQIKWTDRSGDDRKEIRHYRINRDSVRGDIAALIEAEKSFWGYVKAKKEPPLFLTDI